MWALLEYENKSRTSDQPPLAQDKETETQVGLNAGKQTCQDAFLFMIYIIYIIH